MNQQSAQKSNKKTQKRVNIKEKEYQPPSQNRMMNRIIQASKKNLMDGQIKLNYLTSDDIVPENNYNEFRDYDREDLERPIERQSIFMENVKDGSFTRINMAYYQKISEMQKSKETQKPSLQQNEYVSLIGDINDFCNKTGLSFLGILCGMLIMHLLSIFIDTDNNITFLNSYSSNALRINQIFMIFTIFSLIGSLNGYFQSRNSQFSNIQDQVKFLVPSFCIICIYGILMYNHFFIMKLSRYTNEISQKYDQLKSEYSLFRILNIVQTFFAIIGWYTYVIFVQFDANQNEQMTMGEEKERENM